MRFWIGVRKDIALLAVLGWTLLGAGTPGRAQSGLQQEVAGVAKSIQKLLAGRGEDSVAINNFGGQGATNYGPGIQHQLGAALQALKVRIDSGAKLSLSGEYLVIADNSERDHPGLIAVRLNVRVNDASGEVLATLQTDLKGTGDLAQLVGATVPLSPNGDRYRRNEEIKQSLKNPSVHVNGTRIAASADSLYAVEVLVKPYAGASAEPRAPKVEGGKAFVDIQRDEIYELRLYNASKDDVAASIHIDGLDVFTFSEVLNPKTGQKYRYYIVPPYDKTTVLGWHKRDQEPNNILSFLVTAYGQGASAHAPPQAVGQTGVITVAFAKAWTGKAPADEPKSRSAGANETGFGPPLSQRVQAVQRQIGIVREVVTVRYSR